LSTEVNWYVGLGVRIGMNRGVRSELWEWECGRKVCDEKGRKEARTSCSMAMETAETLEVY